MMTNLELEDDLLADRLNLEPVVLLGYTDKELIFAIKVSFFLSFTLGLLGGYLIGKPMPGLGFGFLLGIGLVYAGGKLLQQLKRGRPDYYYQMRLKLWLSRHGLGKTALIRYGGTMNLGRTRWPRL